MAERLEVARPVLRRHARGQQGYCLFRRHFAHMDDRFGIHHEVEPPRCDQSSTGLFPSLQKWFQARWLPSIVDDQKAVTILELFSKFKLGVFFVHERWLVAG